MKRSISKDFTQGSIPKQLLLFALPFMASNALQVLYSTIDMIIVGEYVGKIYLETKERPKFFLDRNLEEECGAPKQIYGYTIICKDKIAYIMYEIKEENR